MASRHVQLDLKVNSPADAKSVVHDEMEANRKKANASLRTAKQATGGGASVVSKAIDTLGNDKVMQRGTQMTALAGERMMPSVAAACGGKGGMRDKYEAARRASAIAGVLGDPRLVKLLEKEKSDKARRTKSLEARTAKDVKRTLERGNKSGQSDASRAAEQQQQQAARQRSRREGRNYWRHKVSNRDRYEIGPGFRASSRIGKILSDLGNEDDWASQVILRHQMATIIQAIIRGYLLRKHWRASPDAVVADLKATQRAAKAEVTRRAGLRLQLQLAATNEKLKAKAGDVQLPMIGKGAVGRHGATGSSKDGTAGAGAGPVKKGLWAGSSKKAVVTAKDEGNDSGEEVRESESDVSDLDEDDIAMVKLRAQTPPWQKLESSAGEGQWAKLNNKSRQGRLDMLWDSQESLARMGAIKGRRMERDPSGDEIAIARGKYDLEAPLSPNLISALLVDRYLEKYTRLGLLDQMPLKSLTMHSLLLEDDK